MRSKFFCGITTEPQDGYFLIIGYSTSYHVALAFLLPESHRDQIQFGQLIDVTLEQQGQTFSEEGEDLSVRVGTWHDQGKSAKYPYQDDAARYMDAINDFMKEQGWTEEVGDIDLHSVLEQWDEAFSRFPERPTGDMQQPILLH